MDQRARIMDALQDVYDPCCEDRGLSVVDMGLIEDVRIDGARASVDLVLTSGWCPFMVPLIATIRERIAAVSTVAEADVRVVWHTAWTSERLSTVARERLQFLPPPNQLAAASRPAAAAAPDPMQPTSEVTP